jgi:hypothetical protein
MAITKTILETQLKKFGKVKVSGNSFKVLLEDGSAKSRIQFLILNTLTDVKSAGETPTILIRSDASRNSKTLGIPGLRIIVSIENSRVKKALSI